MVNPREEERIVCAQNQPPEGGSSGVWSTHGLHWRDTAIYAIHDAKNHVLVLMDSVEFLRETCAESPTDPAVTEELELMRSSCRRLAALLKETLAAARDEACQLLPTPMDAREIVTAAVTQLRKHAASRRTVTVTVEPGNQPATVTDALLTRRILDNLLHNAIQHSPPNSQVSVRCSVRGDGLRVEVIDQGPGIPADRTDSIFEPFVSDSGSADAQEHAGLGLSFCRAAARALGGEVLVSNGDRNGAVFTLALPVMGVDQQDEDLDMVAAS